jgi:hypothetical protein
MPRRRAKGPKVKSQEEWKRLQQKSQGLAEGSKKLRLAEIHEGSRYDIEQKLKPAALEIRKLSVQRASDLTIVEDLRKLIHRFGLHNTKKYINKFGDKRSKMMLRDIELDMTH